MNFKTISLGGNSTGGGKQVDRGGYPRARRGGEAGGEGGGGGGGQAGRHPRRAGRQGAVAA